MEPRERLAQAVVDNQDRVFRLLRSLIRDRNRIEDLAQEVFLRLTRAWSLFRSEADVSTYIYRITLNVARDEWSRRRAASIQAPFDTGIERAATNEPSAEQKVVQEQLRDLLWAALDMLPPREREAMLLYHQEERSYEEIARILDLPVGTVRTHLHRGRQRLREFLKRELVC